MNFDLDAIQTALDDAESVVFAFKNAREDLSEEVWENLPDEITEILDHLMDLECSMGMEDIEGWGVRLIRRVQLPPQLWPTGL